MPLSLFDIRDVDDWKTRAGGVLYVIKAVTVEDQPIVVTLKTSKVWEATLCQRAKDVKQFVWADWRRGFGFSEGQILSVKLDETKFSYDEAS